MIADLIAGPDDSAARPDPSRRDHPLMTRRTLFVALAGGILVAPLTAETQQAQGPKAAKIGFPLGGTLSTPSVQMEPFKQTLRERGMDRGTEPHARVSNKRFELLKEADPHIVRVAVIYNPLNSGHELAVVAIEAAAKTLKIRIQRLAVRAPADFDAVFPVMTPQRVDAVTIVEDAMIHSYALRVVDVALKRRVPAVFGLSILVEAGGFISYGPNRAELWHKAALLTDKILRGAKPGDLPVEQPTKFELVVNLKTARTLGLTSPQSLLLKGAKPADLPVEQPTQFELVINLKTARALGITVPHSLLLRADEVIQ
jgi:putative ABC transport system substrate-binding protein